MRYAESTSVSSEKSRAEIERTLQRYGATGFMYGWQKDSALVAFEMNGKSIKFILPLPERESFARTGGNHPRRRTENQIAAAWEKACRQRWRALTLCIKAKLEAVESEITTFEHEFLAHFVTANGQTVGDRLIPQLSANLNSPALALGWDKQA